MPNWDELIDCIEAAITLADDARSALERAELAEEHATRVWVDFGCQRPSPEHDALTEAREAVHAAIAETGRRRAGVTMALAYAREAAK